MALKVIYNQQKGNKGALQWPQLIAWEQLAGYSEGRTGLVELENAGPNTREDVPAEGERVPKICRGVPLTEY